MDVGMMMLFTNYGWDDCPDGRVWEEELRLAAIAADSGFDCLWSAEHHFNDYSFVPDNMHLMSHLTALHPHMDVGTAAVILPWHDPLRVAEKRRRARPAEQGENYGSASAAAWRGASSRPSASAWTSRVPVFDEAAPIDREGAGDRLHRRRRSALQATAHRNSAKNRKTPSTGRIYAVASSEESVNSAAKLGAHVVMFADRPWEMRAPVIEKGRELHRQYHGTETANDHADGIRRLQHRPRRLRKRKPGSNQGKFVESNFYHYEFLGEHFRHREGLRFLPAKSGDREGSRHGRRRRRLHEGGQLGHAGQDFARPRRTPRAGRRFRTQTSPSASAAPPSLWPSAASNCSPRKYCRC